MEQRETIGMTQLRRHRLRPLKRRLEKLRRPETIAQAARDEGIEHIVMGTRGLGSIQGLLLGSVAMKVIHLAEVPITLIK